MRVRERQASQNIGIRAVHTPASTWDDYPSLEDGPDCYRIFTSISEWGRHTMALESGQVHCRRALKMARPACVCRWLWHNAMQGSATSLK